MAKLIYATPTSLDGYIADDGNFEWSAPDDEVFAFISDVLRPIGTYLYGRRTYETMAVWETPDVIPGLKPFHAGLRADLARGCQDRLFQIAGDRRYIKDPSGAAIRPAGGSRPEGSVASRCFGGWSDARRTGDPGGLVDEYHLFVVPVIRGGGKRVLPGEVSIKLDLLEERRFANGWVCLRYRTRT